jgi:hypothetical protein
VGPFTARSGIKAEAGTEKKKGETEMKAKVLALPVALFLTCIAAIPSHAQKINRINIPFAFQAGDKTLPAGEYNVRRAFENSPAALILQTASAEPVTMVVMTQGVESRDLNGVGKMVFHRYGNEYFLSQIWTGTARGRQLYKSRREKEVARSYRDSEVAILFEPATLRP